MKASVNWKVKREIARKYDASSHVYEVLYREEQEAKIESALKHMRLRKTDLALDVGCGTGLLFDRIKGFVSFVVGLDMSRNLLKKASYKSKDSPNVALILADADCMPLVDGVFDKVFAVTVLQNMPHIDITLKEINRVANRSALITVTGLKKAFKKAEFLMLLNKAGLEVLSLRVDSQLLGYVAVCRKR